MKSKAFLLFVCCLSLVFYTQAQRVGLVLSGGGAKGLAHVGLIQALEENHIPIDYITGTSIGAIVGSLYAIGMSPD
ncbi:MAG: patatin-like phospholipase family protein, partial [Bacteroidales bacterium]